MPKLDRMGMGKSDPMCIVAFMNRDNQWQEIGRTEFVDDVTEVTFETKVTCPLDQDLKELRFDVYDIDARGNTYDLSKQDFIGGAFPFF